MPISELVAVGRALDPAYRCPLGDDAARRWGRGQAVFVRSSASHVFVTDRDAGGTRLVLRMRPAGDATLARCAAVAAALAAAGAPVAPSVRSVAGHQVESVAGYTVMALRAVEGEALDDERIDADLAAVWGETLAAFHAAGDQVEVDGIPHDRAPAGLDLPRRPDVFGLLHGDPEPDNVVLAGGEAVLVDLDDAHRGWFAADVAFALRAWSDPVRGPDLQDPVPAAFLAGYRRRRPFTAAEAAWLPALARASAEESLRRLDTVLAEPARADWPQWATELDDRLRRHAAQLRSALHPGDERTPRT